MALQKFVNLFCIIAFSAIVNSVAVAIPIEVGTGENSAELYIEWDDGYVAEFVVDFEDVTITGFEMFDIIEAQTSLTTVRQDFGWGIFIDGIEFNGHSNIGYGGGEDWWHYWIKDAGQTEWISPAFGVADRILYNGDADGWIYGRAGTVPEPTTLLLLAIGAFVLRKPKE